jgi:hypothetical protein
LIDFTEDYKEACRMGFFKKLKDRVTSPKATITLKLNKNSFALGENLEGSLSVTSEEEIDATEIRAELRCEERRKTMKYETETTTLPGGGTSTRPVWREVWETATIFSANPQGSGSIHLSVGYKREFPFNTGIPAGGQPTYSSMDRNVEWKIKGVIGIKGRPDVTTSEYPIQVAMAPVAPTVITEKIVEREVVMIPCKYCGSLMPQTALSCPNCGAKRTA